MNRVRRIDRGRGGFQLFEVLVVIALVMFFMGFGLKLFVSVAQLGAYSTLQQGRAAALDELQRALRDNLREGRGPVARVGEHVAGADLLIVALPPEEAEARYALWGLLDEGPHLVRYVLREEGGRLTAESYRRFAYPVDRFAYETMGDGQGVKVTFSLRRDEGERVFETPHHTVQVAYRGARP